MIVIETNRLTLRRLCAQDAAFMLELMNDPSWLKYIGDRGARNLADAGEYIAQGPAAMYSQFGFGLYLTEIKDSEEPIGICGLVKRDYLADVDIGFAFLPRYWGNGFAFESASAVLEYAANTLGLERVLAITTSDNHSSIKLLDKLGFRFEKMVQSNKETEQLKLFSRSLKPQPL